MASNIEIQKKCEWCGTIFTAHKITTAYCSHRCANLAYKDRVRKKRIQEFHLKHDAELKPNSEKEFLTGKRQFIIRDAQFGSEGRAANWSPDVIPLAYVPENINCVPMGTGNCVVISSQFSGCLMAAFTYRKHGSAFETIFEKDQKYVCHIAIEEKEKGKECETIFSKAIDKGKINDFIIFNPAAIVPTTNRNKFSKMAAGLGYNVNFLRDVYGLISSDNECFSFVMEKEHGTLKPHVLSIVKWADRETVELFYSIDMGLNVLLKQ